MEIQYVTSPNCFFTSFTSMPILKIANARKNGSFFVWYEWDDMPWQEVTYFCQLAFIRGNWYIFLFNRRGNLGRVLSYFLDIFFGHICYTWCLMNYMFMIVKLIAKWGWLIQEYIYVFGWSIKHCQVIIQAMFYLK